MAEKARRFFVYGNTAQGFINKLDTNLAGIESLYILQGPPAAGKIIMTAAIESACDRSGLMSEKLHCPSAPDTLDGVILPQNRIAIIDGTDVHTLKQPVPSIQTYLININAAFEQDGLLSNRERASTLFSQLEKSHENAFSFFKIALDIHDEWEKIYIDNMDFSKADELAGDTAEKLLGHHRRDKMALSKERFFGAATPSGAIDYIESLTASVSKDICSKAVPEPGNQPCSGSWWMLPPFAALIRRYIPALLIPAVWI